MKLSQHEVLIAFCPLEEGKPHHTINLSNKNVIISRNNQDEYYPIDFINNLQIIKRFALVPFIAGGIVVPLCLLAIANGRFDVWVTLILLMSGIFSMYWGWEGYKVLEINETQRKVDIPFQKEHYNLKPFIEFANAFVKQNKTSSSEGDHIKLPSLIILVKKSDDNKDLNALLNHANNTNNSICFNYQTSLINETLNSGQYHVLEIDPSKLDAEIIINEDDGQFKPYIKGEINKDAVTNYEF